jgi:hypothetical protein
MNLLQLFSTETAHALTFNVTRYGIDASISSIANNIGSTILITTIPLCSAIFIAGAFFYAISAGDEQRKALGKDMMVGAVIGVAIVAGARTMINLAYFFLYGN